MNPFPERNLKHFLEKLKPSNEKLLPSQTWVHLPIHSNASLLTTGCGKEKCSAYYCRMPKQGVQVNGAQKSWTLKGFQRKVFKDRVRERVQGMWSAHGCSSDWLMMWGNQESASSTFWFQQVWGLHACGQHTVKFFHLVGVSVSRKQLRRYCSEYYLQPLKRN